MLWSFKDIRMHYDRIAATYDAINQRTYSYGRRFSDLVPLVRIDKKEIVLDIFTRTGKNIYFLPNRALIKAICIDVSPRLIDIARERLAKEKLNFLPLLIGNLPLPLKDNSVDKILCIETLEHLSEPDKFLEELRRVIKKERILVLTTPNPLWEPIHWLAEKLKLHHPEGPHRFISKKELYGYLNKLNFKIERETTKVLIPGGPDIFIKFGEFLEKILPESIMSLIGLRRIFICSYRG